MEKMLCFILAVAMIFAMGLSAMANGSIVQDMVDSYTLVGDINLDGNIDAADALDLLLFVVVKSPPPMGTDAYERYQCMRIIVDVNDDDITNAADALMILQYAVGKRTDFPRKDYSQLQTLVKPEE